MLPMEKVLYPQRTETRLAMLSQSWHPFTYCSFLSHHISCYYSDVILFPIEYIMGTDDHLIEGKMK